MPLVADYCDYVGENGILDGFVRVLEWLRIILVCGGVHVHILPRNNFRIFLARPEIFSVFSVSRQNFLELF
jgi:hypothetical protein